MKKLLVLTVVVLVTWSMCQRSAKAEARTERLVAGALCGAQVVAEADASFRRMQSGPLTVEAGRAMTHELCASYDAAIASSAVKKVDAAALLSRGGHARWERIGARVAEECPQQAGGVAQSAAAVGFLTSALLMCKVDGKLESAR